MAPRPRPRRLSVKLTDQEYNALEARVAAEGTTKAAVVRAAIASPRARGAGAGLTHDEALGLLSDAAKRGLITAMIALEPALRLAPVKPGEPTAEQPVPPGEPTAEQPVPDELSWLRAIHAEIEARRR
jgi:Ribbon-helix-helix protein, copG family